MAAAALDIPKPVSPTWRNFRDALRRHPTAIIGGVVLLAMILVALLAPWLGTVDPQAVAPVKRLKQPGAVLLRHALKNAAVPIATVIGIGIALLIGGAIVTETVFALPGIGRHTVDAILRRDYPIIHGEVLIFSASYVLINLAVDLSYMFFDPRIRY